MTNKKKIGWVFTVARVCWAVAPYLFDTHCRKQSGRWSDGWNFTGADSTVIAVCQANSQITDFLQERYFFLFERRGGMWEQTRTK